MQSDPKLQALYASSDRHVRGRVADVSEAEHVYGDYVRFVQGVSPLPADLLDVGCGNGWSAHLFSRLGYHTTGVDLNAACFVPLADSNLMFREASVLDLPFDDRSFDVVSANQMLEHVPDPRRALSEMLRVLRPGGNLCIVGPNLISPLTPARTVLRYAWQNRPYRRIFVRDAAMARHPCGNTLPEAMIGILANFARIAVRSVCGGERFEMRQPDQTPPFVADNDACYLCNPLDLVRFLQEKGCKLLRNGKPGRPNWTAPFAAGTWVAVCRR